MHIFLHLLNGGYLKRIRQGNYKERNEDSPGPGSFEAKNTFVEIIKDGPKVGFRGSRPRENKNDSPGPGHYSMTDAHLPSPPKVQ